MIIDSGITATFIDYHRTFLGTWFKIFFEAYDGLSNEEFLMFCEALLLELNHDENRICSTTSRQKAKLNSVDVINFPDKFFNNPFKSLCDASSFNLNHLQFPLSKVCFLFKQIDEQSVILFIRHEVKPYYGTGEISNLISTIISSSFNLSDYDVWRTKNLYNSMNMLRCK